MKKILLLMLGALSYTYGQDVYTGASASGNTSDNKLSEIPVERSLLFYIYGNSGNINSSSSTPVFSGNDTESGLRYSENFARAPWLTVSVQLDISVGMSWEYDFLGRLLPNSGSVQSSGILPVLHLNTYFTPFLRLGMSSDGIFSIDTFYTKNVGTHFFTILGGTDLKFLNINASTYTFGLGYEYKINGWVLNTAFGVKFGNSFLASVHFRLDGLIAYKIERITLWGRLRYEPRQLFSQSSPQHNIMLMAGLNYDIIKN